MAKSVINTIAHECLASRIRLLNRLVTAAYDTALRPHGLRIGQLNLLVSIASRGPLRERALSAVEAGKIDPQPRPGPAARAVGLRVHRGSKSLPPAGLASPNACRFAQGRRKAQFAHPPIADGAMQVVQNLWLSEDLLAEKRV